MAAFSIQLVYIGDLKIDLFVLKYCADSRVIVFN